MAGSPILFDGRATRPTHARFDAAPLVDRLLILRNRHGEERYLFARVPLGVDKITEVSLILSSNGGTCDIKQGTGNLSEFTYITHIALSDGFTVSDWLQMRNRNGEFEVGRLRNGASFWENGNTSHVKGNGTTLITEDFGMTGELPDTEKLLSESSQRDKKPVIMMDPYKKECKGCGGTVTPESLEAAKIAARKDVDREQFSINPDTNEVKRQEDGFTYVPFNYIAPPTVSSCSVIQINHVVGESGFSTSTLLAILLNSDRAEERLRESYSSMASVYGTVNPMDQSAQVQFPVSQSLPIQLAVLKSTPRCMQLPQNDGRSSSARLPNPSLPIVRTRDSTTVEPAIKLPGLAATFNYPSTKILVPSSQLPLTKNPNSIPPKSDGHKSQEPFASERNGKTVQVRKANSVHTEISKLNPNLVSRPKQTKPSQKEQTTTPKFSTASFRQSQKPSHIGRTKTPKETKKLPFTMDEPKKQLTKKLKPPETTPSKKPETDRAKTRTQKLLNKAKPFEDQARQANSPKKPNKKSEPLKPELSANKSEKSKPKSLQKELTHTPRPIFTQKPNRTSRQNIDEKLGDANKTKTNRLHKQKHAHLDLQKPKSKPKNAELQKPSSQPKRPSSVQQVRSNFVELPHHSNRRSIQDRARKRVVQAAERRKKEKERSRRRANEKLRIRLVLSNRQVKRKSGVRSNLSH